MRHNYWHPSTDMEDHEKVTETITAYKTGRVLCMREKDRGKLCVFHLIDLLWRGQREGRSHVRTCLRAVNLKHSSRHKQYLKKEMIELEIAENCKTQMLCSTATYTFQS